MKRIDELFSASIKWMFSSPGIPKTYLTSSFSRHLTTSLATVTCSVEVPSSGTFSFFMPAALFNRHDHKKSLGGFCFVFFVLARPSSSATDSRRLNVVVSVLLWTVVCLPNRSCIGYVYGLHLSGQNS